MSAYAGAGPVSVRSGNVTVGDANGVVAVARNGSATATDGDVAKNGDGAYPAISMSASTTAALTFANVTATTGTSSTNGSAGGVVFVNSGGAKTVTGNGVRATGNNIGGIGVTSGAGDVTLAGPVSTTGQTARTLSHWRRTALRGCGRARSRRAATSRRALRSSRIPPM